MCIQGGRTPCGNPAFGRRRRYLSRMKPPKRPILAIVAIMLGAVALNLGLAALHGWGPDPWWQSTLTMIVFIWVFLWAWSGFSRPSPPATP